MNAATFARTFLPPMALGAGILLCASGQASASQGTVNFWGNITTQNACVIRVLEGGTLGANADNTTLSSKIPGGKSASVEVVSLTSYTVSVDGPGFFMKAPGGGSANTTFTTTWSATSISNGLTFGERDGSEGAVLPKRRSHTKLEVNLVAQRPDAFPAGQYMAVTTVRCE